jgi:hypothetical protein
VSDEKKTFVEAVQQLRHSGAYGKHQDRRTKRLRTRKAKKDQALREQQED